MGDVRQCVLVLTMNLTHCKCLEKYRRFPIMLIMRKFYMTVVATLFVRFGIPIDLYSLGRVGP